MNKHFKMILLSILIICSLASNSLIVKAETLEAERLLSAALTEKNFYSFNIAYKAIMDLSDENYKNKLFMKLDTISSIVWTKDIRRFNSMLEWLINTPNGKVYDQIIAEVSESSLGSIDKGYLLGELTSWGRKLVFTPDYIGAVDAVVRAWSNMNSESIIDAENYINKVINLNNKEYLTEELSRIKEVHKKGWSIVNNNKSTVDKVNALSSNPLMTRDDKLANLIRIFNDSVSLELPDGYINTVGGYFILDTILSGDAVKDIYDLQNRIDHGIASAELAKFNGLPNSADINKVVKMSTDEIQADSNNSVFDVTNYVVSLNSPLLKEVNYDLYNWGDLPYFNFNIKDNRIYLQNPKYIKEQNNEIKGTFLVNVMYKDSSATSIINFSIVKK